MNLKKAKKLRRFVRLHYPTLVERKLMARQTTKIIGYRDGIKDDGTLTKVAAYALIALNARDSKRGIYREMKRVVNGKS